METIQDTIIKKVEQYNEISLFFHELPDLDALGACYALRRFIRDKYPEKQVEIIGLDNLDSKFGANVFFIQKYHVPNEFVTKSIGIILDTANVARVWSGRQAFCKELIRIDHHPKIETFADYEWVDASFPATCQMVAELLFKWDPKYVLPPTASYLYAGLLTDTSRFLYLSTLPSTYEVTSKLVDTDFDRQKIHDAIYLKKLDEMMFDSYVLKHVKFDKDLGFAYTKIKKNAFDKFGVELRMSMVHVLNNVEGANIWMTLYYDNVLKRWKGSLRSRILPINQIAEKYNGGGHKNAAGFVIERKSQFKQVVNDVKIYLREYLKKNS